MAEENPDSINTNVANVAENDGNQQIVEGSGLPSGRGFGFGGRRGRGGRFAGGGGDRRPRPNNQNENDFARKRRWGGEGGGGGGPRGGDGPRGGRGGEGEEGQGGFRRGPRDRGDGQGGGWNPDDRLFDRVAQISGPTFELAPIENCEKKFSNRARLYIGNVSPEATEEDIVEAFSKFGETGGWNPDDRLFDRVAQISGPTFELAPIEDCEKKFSNRARLYIGNVSPEATEEDIVEAFSKFGETSELFINKEKNFGFIKLDFHTNAEKAKNELDGIVFKGKPLKIRFAPVGATIKVKNLTPWVTNELLYMAFSVFGEIEKCAVIVDDRGKSIGEGIVEYARKGNANMALRKCDELCYFLTSSLRPVIVQLHDAVDNSDGLPDKTLPKRSQDFCKEREVGPRFAPRGGFEHEYGVRWKELHESYTQKLQTLKQELEIEKDKLETEMELTRFEHETEMLRKQLRNREMDRDRQKREWEMKERSAEEQRVRMQDQLRLQQDDMQARMSRQDEEVRRRQQENSLFMQAHQLDSLLKQEEQSFDEDLPVEFTANLMDSKDFTNPPPRFGDSRGGHWVKESRGGPGQREDFDFQNKRRRF